MFPTLSQWLCWFHILHQKFSDQCLSGLLYHTFSWFFNHSHLYYVLPHVCRYLSPGWLLSSHPFTSPNIAVYSPRLTNNSRNEIPAHCGITIQKWKPHGLVYGTGRGRHKICFFSQFVTDNSLYTYNLSLLWEHSFFMMSDVVRF